MQSKKNGPQATKVIFVNRISKRNMELLQEQGFIICFTNAPTPEQYIRLIEEVSRAKDKQAAVVGSRVVSIGQRKARARR